MKSQTITYLSILFLVGLWCSGILLAPIAELTGHTAVARILYAFFGTVCHQLDSHSLHLGIHKFGVCARCTAMYLGFFAGAIVYPAVRRLNDTRLPGMFWLIVAALPMLVDVVLTVAGFHSASMETRLATGGLFGFALAFTIIPGLIGSVPHLLSSFRRTHANETR